MECIIILIICILVLLILFYVFSINIKKIKESMKDDNITEIVDRFPKNVEICKDILKILRNDKVKIKKVENEKNKTSLYVVLTNTIFIANINDLNTRIQTMAHECIHSVQNKKMLLFNFIYTNIYNIYFILTIILTIGRVYNSYILHASILLIMGIVFFAVRSYLENDAMIKAKFLAKEYMQKYNKKTKICSDEEIDKVIGEYERLNKMGIPTYNYILFAKTISKTIIYLIIACIMTYIC